MIDINRLKKELNNYIKEFDIDDSQIAMKVNHTYRVSALSKQLASHLGLNAEESAVSTCPALFLISIKSFLA